MILKIKKNYISPIDHFLSRYSWFSNEEKNLLNTDNTKYVYDESSLEYVESLFQKSLILIILMVCTIYKESYT